MFQALNFDFSNDRKYVIGQPRIEDVLATCEQIAQDSGLFLHKANAVNTTPNMQRLLFELTHPDSLNVEGIIKGIQSIYTSASSLMKFANLNILFDDHFHVEIVLYSAAVMMV